MALTIRCVLELDLNTRGFIVLCLVFTRFLATRKWLRAGNGVDESVPLNMSLPADSTNLSGTITWAKHRFGSLRLDASLDYRGDLGRGYHHLGHSTDTVHWQILSWKQSVAKTQYQVLHPRESAAAILPLCHCFTFNAAAFICHGFTRPIAETFRLLNSYWSRGLKAVDVIQRLSLGT